MCYSLRTLLIVMLLAPPALAGMWWIWRAFNPPDDFDIVIGGPEKTWFQQQPDGLWKAFRIDGDSVHEINGTFDETPPPGYIILPNTPESVSVLRHTGQSSDEQSAE